MDARTLWEVMGKALPLARYEQLLPAYEKMLNIVGARTVNQCAMIAAQLGHESVGLKYQEEIASGAAYEWRGDLGNIYAGDGVRFKGHGWIQVTGRHNHTAVSKWAHARGIVPTPDYFVTNPTALGNDEYCWVGPAWYLTAARPGFMSAADHGELENCTRQINGGLNGLDDRRRRWNHALTLGTRLLPGKAAPVKICHPMKEGTYRVSSGYGDRWGGFHAGLDFAADIGTPIYAPADGIVIEGRERTNVAGFGRWVWLDCQASVGRDFIFGHVLPSGIKVSGGQRVKAGDLIAEVGNEGQSTGPHLHFEVWGPPGRLGGRHEDPAPWLDKNVNDGETEDFLMALSDDEQRELLDKTRRVHHELVHEFQSRYKNAAGERSPYTDTLVGYVLELDKKIENIHADILPWGVKVLDKIKTALTRKESTNDH